jgi:superfamily II DNA or RNA helicase
MYRMFLVWALGLTLSSQILHAEQRDLSSGVEETQDTPDSTASPIRLLPHQQYPIDYLVKHPEVKGLLINHYMGTGKTYLALGFSEQFADKDVVILAPGFIESHWLEHIRAYKVKNPHRYHFISYNDAPQKLSGKDMSNTLLIVDEVHNLVKFLKSPNPAVNRQYSDLYERLRKSYKIVGLSGTPILLERA